MRLRSLRVRVMALIAMAFLPVAALEVNTAVEQRQRAAEEMEAEAIRLARLVASNQQALIESVRQLLMTLAQVDAVRTRNAPVCEPLLRGLRKQNSMYANLGVTDATGKILCAAENADAPVNVSDRLYFQRAHQSNDFAVGDYQVGRIVGRPTVNMAYPVLDRAGKFDGVVFVALDLMVMSQLGTRIMLPAGATMEMTDGTGMFLMRYPEPRRWIGTRGRVVSPKRNPHDGEGWEWTTKGFGEDGVERVYAIERLNVPAPGSLRIGVGVQYRWSLAAFSLRLMRQLGLVTGIALAALGGAWLFGSALIVRPARHLVGVARKVSAGNLDVRSTIKGGTGEFGEIGAAFNQMADVLARRIAELDETRQELEQARGDLETRVELRTAELRKVQETLQLRNRALAALNSGVIVTDPKQPDNPVVDVNPAFERITGYAEDETIGRNCRFLQGPDTEGEEIETMRRAISEEGDCQVVLKNYRKDGTAFWNEIKIAPVRDSDGRLTHFVGILTDVTERIHAQQAMERVAEELRRSNEELEQFAYVASHDLQEPLRMVASYTQLLARRYKDKLDQNAQDFIGFAVEGAQRMQSFIQDLLLYSRVGTHGRPFERMDAGAALQRAVENLRFAIAEKNAEVVATDLPQVYADPVQLTQLFQNLIGNAIKFCRDRPLRVDISAVKRGREWEFTVRDNGIGIAPEDRDRIFVIFQRLHSRQEYEGTGIGLAICKKIVERHGGKIWVKSETGDGTEFHFTIAEPESV